jgi:hypothetical protein
MKKIMLLNLMLCARLFSPAQTTITAAEYFFDVDPGVGNAIAVPITAADTITATFSFSVSSLTVGRHLFCFRTKDNLGKWSLATTTPFTVEPKGTQITSAEYFFDADPGMGNGNGFSFSSADTISNNFSLPATGASNGRHSLCLRTKDNAGNWSAITTAFFLAEPKGSQLVKGEYFLDSDPGMGNGTAFTFSATDTITNNFSLAVPSTNLGQHLLCVRMKDNAGNWGMNTSLLLQVAPPDNACTDAEYYFDVDPGVGHGTLLNLGMTQDTIDLTNMAVHVPGSMPLGTHYLFIRSKNDGLVFSLASIDTFDVTAGALPVELVRFTAHKFNEQSLLNWQTAQEINNHGFEIQRSADGNNFTVIGWVNGMGNASSPTDYSFTDLAPLKGKNLYRLKQVDNDGHFKFSPIRTVDFETGFDLLIYPNPVTSQLTVKFTDDKNKQIKITDMSGRIVWEKADVAGLVLYIPVEKFAKGMFLISVTSNSGKQVVQKFIKE